ncbi:hypothetical protein [Paenibacillus eucommiae]|uniref:Uncharacterized protein n=1 Tax=Paenibacillus eucommiae TaxID=1355755 RepID=A0ABS4J4Y5_9BACL|nr:hypothetical protein [Paenibacillus eucommiae]MBP1994897.1 hypothetical protein [Paenibacillus eucommiae]
MLRIAFTNDSPCLISVDSQESYSDLPYQYALRYSRNDQEIYEGNLEMSTMTHSEDDAELQGSFAASGILLKQRFRHEGDGISEEISITNPNIHPLMLKQVYFGFTKKLEDKSDYRLRAIPFLVQLDGSVHDYTIKQLVEGQAINADQTDLSREEPLLLKEGLRSEAWAWGDDHHGIVIIKYNNEQVEYSVARAANEQGEAVLRYGGAGLSLFSEPSDSSTLEPGQTFTFGKTYYFPYEGNIQTAYAVYRTFLENRGHTFGRTYNPPVNWNVLYDIGWHHSNAEQLRIHYHKEAIMKEASKAKDIGCELLYLDPGWEVAEGLTLWDESRLGDVSELVHELKEQYNLDLGYRTILRAYKDGWNEDHYVRHSYGLMQPDRMEPVWGYHFWEPCLCDPEYFNEKLQRILAITKQGMRFMMFDEMDWRGPCSNPNHGHQVPSTAIDHIKAVYRLAGEVRRQYPAVLTEVHDPVWPWTTSLYVPTYFRQGPEGVGYYDENWGFEYMWNCIEDLKTGKALALYYYNLGCSIPLYLHITMAADNDACVFFWWTASTVRHLGIGGKYSHPTVEFAGELVAYDQEKRYSDYRDQLSVYQKLKPYFVRGTFHGIAEHVHLHTLEGTSGGVINVFNLMEEERELEFTISLALLGGEEDLLVTGAEASWSNEEVTFRLTLAAMSPGIVVVGEAAGLV